MRDSGSTLADPGALMIKILLRHNQSGAWAIEDFRIEIDACRRRVSTEVGNARTHTTLLSPQSPIPTERNNLDLLIGQPGMIQIISKALRLE